MQSHGKIARSSPVRRPRPKHPELPYGVYFRNKAKPYIVKFRKKFDTIYVGSFSTISEAVEAANNFLRNNPR